MLVGRDDDDDDDAIDDDEDDNDNGSDNQNRDRACIRMPSGRHHVAVNAYNRSQPPPAHALYIYMCINHRDSHARTNQGTNFYSLVVYSHFFPLRSNRMKNTKQ